MTTYEESGVHNDAKEDVSKILYHAARETWKNREGKLGEVISAFDNFSGVRAIDVSNLPKGTLMNMGFDGVGTKMEIAERMNDYRTIAYDLFAMVCDDAIVRGAEPVLIGSILDTNSLKGKNGPYTKQVRQLAEGYVKAAREANVAVVNGECAELGSRVGGYGGNNFALQLAHSYISVNLNRDNFLSIKLLSSYLVEKNEEVKKKILEGIDLPERKFLEGLENMVGFNSNWGASAVWFANKDRLFTGMEIKEGNDLIALREQGFRSNGLSLVRKILEDNFGNEWHKKEFMEGTYGSAVLTPSRIYTKAVVDMFGGFNGLVKTEVHGVAHITGGGIPEKLGRMLEPSGLSAYLNSLIAPPLIMEQVRKMGDVSHINAYKTWNMGNGLIIATPRAEEVIKIAGEHQIYAKKIGKVVKEDKPKVIIEAQSSGPKERLEFLID